MMNVMDILKIRWERRRTSVSGNKIRKETYSQTF
jgi:hypothetical protein